jgi:hypothetical protein
MILKKNTSPIIAGFLALIAAILAGLNLIYPLRTGALVSTLAWPIIATKPRITLKKGTILSILHFLFFFISLATLRT